ncbi:30S ribosomal protein S5 [Candidatus Roizmanbacteria bacterium]|nr:MAG: 30S ribosomal protein S5 [Candidatus Roizmanbacteria bacterium]
MAKGKLKQNDENKMDERVLNIRRVSKKTTGGNYISFSALVAVGDGEGSVGIGIGRGLEVPPAIQKAITQAKKRMVKLPIYNDTLPHEIKLKYKSSRLLLKPAPPGTGLKVGGVVRAVLDIAGVNNASGKIIGTRNQITNAYAVIEAIKRLKPRITEEKKEETAVESEPKAVVQETVLEEAVTEAKPKKAEKKETKVKATSAKATAGKAKKTAPKKKPVKSDK